MMTTPLQSVREFHETFDGYRSARPTLPNLAIRDMRKRLLAEEWTEYLDAEKENDLIAIADALADMIYVIYGTAVSYGLPMDDIFAEVHRSNMSKLGPDSKPILRADGKVMKGPNYTKPDIQRILSQYGEESSTARKELI